MDFKVKRVRDMYAKEGKPVPPEIETMLGGGGPKTAGGK